VNYPKIGSYMNAKVFSFLILVAFFSISCVDQIKEDGPAKGQKTLTVIQPEPPTSNAELDAFEVRTKIKLPSEYRNWLLKYNGGSPRPRGFVFDERGKRSEANISWFYAIYGADYEGNVTRLEDEIQTFKIKETRVPIDLIPIASASLGNQICLGYQASNLGKVYFWDHERECDGAYDNCYLIANSFNEFIASLKDD
jgi:hypothetical protein